jgi:glycosyltransferase involved in cell wall biosynthesis
MKLLMTTDTIGGVWTYSIELARALSAHGVAVVLAAMGARVGDDQRRQAESLPNVTLRESAYKLEWMQDPWDDVRKAGRWLLDLEGEFTPDLVHLNGYAHASLPFRAPILLVAHSCVCSWWRAVKREAAPREWDRYRWEVASGLAGADCVVAPTWALLDAIRGEYGPVPHARVIPNGRDASLYRVGRKENFVLAAGRLWDEAKNVAALDAVAADLPCAVYLAGDARGTDGAEANVNCSRLGRLDERSLADYYARAAVYALPARYEPFGLSVLEAALSGCALVLGDIPSLREVWGDAATFVDPDDRTALRNAIRQLVDDPAHRGAMADAAHERAKAFTPRRTAAGYLAAYGQLISCQRTIEQTAAVPVAAAHAAAAVDG